MFLERVGVYVDFLFDFRKTQKTGTCRQINYWIWKVYNLEVLLWNLFRVKAMILATGANGALPAIN